MSPRTSADTFSLRSPPATAPITRCISSVAPWQPYFIGRQQNPGSPPSWKPFNSTDVATLTALIGAGKVNTTW